MTKCYQVLEELKHTFYVQNFFSENGVVYEICGKIWYSRTSRNNNIIWHMRFACWITEATDKHSEHIILCIFAVTMVARKHLKVASVSTLLVLLMLM
jgi:hypothetical protein